MTQEQLGERIGVTNKTVSRWKTGNHMPPVECLELLSDIYQISINVKNIAVFVMVIAMGFISNTLNIVAVAAKKKAMDD